MKSSKPGSVEDMDAASSAKKPGAKLSRDIQSKLGQQLRAVYDDVVSQGIPDRFADLLNQLDSGKTDIAGGKGER